MSMDPEHFHDLLDRAVTHDPGSGADVNRAVAGGERRLRRNRWIAVACSTAGVLVIGALSVAVPSLGGDGREAQPAVDSGPPSSDADLLDSCRHGNQGDVATEKVFGSGPPAVKAVSRNPHQVILAIESTDRKHWAECFIHLQSAEFASGMTVYRSTGRSTNTSYSYGGGCGLVDGDVDPACTTFVVSWVDRLPRAVAAVRFDLFDGASPTVPTADGYVVLNHRGQAPGGASDQDDLSESPIQRVTYLDATGKPVAAEAMDGSGTGPDHDRVGVLPKLRAFPSLRVDDTAVPTS